ncbi:MAG: type II toxin-antitoxin system HicB family antitoxin [Candidatus Desantisbacteria bacterium]
MILNIIIEPGENGYYIASCPAIKGCHSQGKTTEETLNNIKEAILGCLEVLNERTIKNNESQQLYQVAV